MELSIKTEQPRQVIDITEKVQAAVKSAAEAVNVYVAHTTCAVTTADLDPGAGEDMIEAVWRMVPKLDYRRHHDPKHFPAHVAASVIGPSVTVPVSGDGLVLGQWQRLVLVEFDGPRQRKLTITNL